MPQLVHPSFAALILLGPLGCADGVTLPGVPAQDAGEDKTEKVAIVDNAAWSLRTEPGHLFDDSAGECLSSGYAEEDGVFEIVTDACDPGTFTQELLVAVSAGERIQLIFWHLGLFNPYDAEAHIAFAVGENGDDLRWEVNVDLPADEEVYRPVLEVDDDIAAGTPVWLHVHNHGTNSYKLLEVTAGPQSAYP